MKITYNLLHLSLQSAKVPQEATAAQNFGSVTKWVSLVTTKRPEAYAVQDQSAATTAEQLVEELFCQFDVPEELHSE